MGQTSSHDHHRHGGSVNTNRRRPDTQKVYTKSGPASSGNFPQTKPVRAAPAAKQGWVAPQQKKASPPANTAAHTPPKVRPSPEEEHILTCLDEIAENEGGRITQLLKSNHLTSNNSGTYETLFAPYMDRNLIAVRIGEPFLHLPYQMRNLVKFIECCVANAPSLKLIKLETKLHEGADEQKKNLQDIDVSLRQRGISFVIEYSDIHDRKIIFNNNVLFRLGSGLHFFDKGPSVGRNLKYFVGMSDQRLRSCKDTNVDAFQFVY